MADAILAKLIGLLTSPASPELRRAALLVSGSVGSARDRALTKALLANLQETDLETRLAAIQAVGQLRLEEALGPLQEYALKGGPELEASVQAAAQLGARGIKAMSKVMASAAPSLRSRMAAVLAKSGTGGGLVATAHALLDADPKVVDAAARSLAAEVPSFTPAQNQALAKFLIESLEGEPRPSSHAEAAIVRVLGILPGAGAEEVFWSRLDGGPPEVRAAALHALGQCTTSLTDARLGRLTACAAAADFAVVAHALMILKKAPVGAKHAKHWLRLLEAPDVAARRFAVEKLRGVDSAPVVHGLLGQLNHADGALREDAQEALLVSARGRGALIDKLLTAESADEGWTLARALAPGLKGAASSLRTRVFEQAAAYHDRDDRRAVPLLFLLREMDAGWLRDQIESLAKGLRTKKKYTEAVGYYRLLTHDPSCAEGTRFELAAAGLKISTHDLAVEARQADPALGQFNRLLQNPALDLVALVKQAKWLELTDLFYLGFHFVEQSHRAREFGKDILELIVKRSPRTELGKNARKKLRSAGAG